MDVNEAIKDWKPLSHADATETHLPQNVNVSESITPQIAILSASIEPNHSSCLQAESKRVKPSQTNSRSVPPPAHQKLALDVIKSFTSLKANQGKSSQKTSRTAQVLRIDQAKAAVPVQPSPSQSKSVQVSPSKKSFLDAPRFQIRPVGFCFSVLEIFLPMNPNSSIDATREQRLHLPKGCLPLWPGRGEGTRTLDRCSNFPVHGDGKRSIAFP